jgi:hypothetical protein
MTSVFGQSGQFTHFINRCAPRERFRHRLQRALPVAFGNTTAFRFFQDFMSRVEPRRHLPQHWIDSLGFNPFRQTFPYLVQ